MKKFISLLLCIGFVLTLSSQITYADDAALHKNTARSELSGLFSLYDEFYYSEENWQLMQSTYESGVQSINNASTPEQAYDILNETAEALIQIHHKGQNIKIAFSADKFVLNKGFITPPTFIRTRIYTPVSNVIYDFYNSEFENKTRNPIYFSGALDNNFELTGIYEGLPRTIDTPDEFDLPTYLYEHVGKTLQEKDSLEHLRNGDYIAGSKFLYSVNNKFPNVKASAVPVCDEDVVRVTFSIYGNGADIGANVFGSEASIGTSADKSEAFWKLAEIYEKNDLNVLLSNESNKTNYTKALGALMIPNLSQNATNKALDKLEAIKPVIQETPAPDADVEVPETGEDTTPETEEEILPETNTSIIFSDVTDDFYGKEAIEYLSSKGYIAGRPDGTFGINEKITRAEFATILARISGFDENGTSIPFADVKEDDWYYNGIAFCYTNKIASGQSATIFNPNTNITRQDLATMLYRYLMFANIASSTEQSTIPFADENEISEYALEAVHKLQNSGIINGYEGNVFMPKGNATRAEAVKMIYNTIK